MIEKVTVQNLIDVMAEKHNMDKKDAELFVKGVFDLVEESLTTEKYIKIKGLGTFKLIDVDSRESINVNTGERIEIQGHTKITFVPENSLKELINKPFSHFETVIISENYDGSSLDVQNEDKLENNFEGEVTTIVEETNDEVVGMESLNEEAIKETVVEKHLDKEIVLEESNDNNILGIDTNSVKKEKYAPRYIIYFIILLIILLIGGLYYFKRMMGGESQNATHSENMAEIILDVQDTVIGSINEADKTIMPIDTTLRPLINEVKVATLADTLDYRIIGTKTFHILNKGETIIRLSLKYYGTKDYWPYIAKYNEKIIKDANNVPIGTKLLIPELETKK